MKPPSIMVLVTVAAAVGLSGATRLCAAASGPPVASVIVQNTTAAPVPVVQQGPVSISGDITVAGTTDVRVKNTTAEPVPVVQQGSVSISGEVTLSGTPSVNVANTPTVTVVNGTGQPLPVRSVDAVASQPFQASLTFVSIEGGGANIYTVPANKRAIVEFVSFHAFNSSYFVNAIISTSVGGNATAHYLSVTREMDYGSIALSTASQVVRIYADPGTKIHIGPDSILVADPPYPKMNASISGVLVDAP